MARVLSFIVVTAFPLVTLPVLRKEAPVEVLFPAEQCILENGKFDVVGKVADGVTVEDVSLQVDGEPCNWKPYAAPVLSASLELSSGFHELRIGETRLRIFVPTDQEKEQAPPWPLYRSHRGKEDVKSCADCHTVQQQNDRLQIGDLAEPTACLKCHVAQSFEATHFHPLDPIASCHICHALHGSVENHLLRKPVKELCAQCHD
ncbi:MAG: cytochrome c3 family protein [Candidatus Zipacnadales bacterium]